MYKPRTPVHFNPLQRARPGSLLEKNKCQVSCQSDGSFLQAPTAARPASWLWTRPRTPTPSPSGHLLTQALCWGRMDGPWRGPHHQPGGAERGPAALCGAGSPTSLGTRALLRGKLELGFVI